MDKKEKVVVLGASSKPDRYSNKAIKMLLEHGHEVIPVHPKEKSVYDLPVVADLSMIDEKINTLTVYVKPSILKNEIQKLIKLNPERIIFNPGTEDSELKDQLLKNNIEVIEACTLVLLSTNQY
jgi:predicted CoA-binding protein